jgi:hypothetical protein
MPSFRWGHQDDLAPKLNQYSRDVGRLAGGAEGQGCQMSKCRLRKRETGVLYLTPSLVARNHHRAQTCLGSVKHGHGNLKKLGSDYQNHVLQPPATPTVGE